MSGDARVIKVLRAQAWERAKGEMQAMLNTFYASDTELNRPSQFKELDAAVEAFVEDIESRGLQE